MECNGMFIEKKVDLYLNCTRVLSVSIYFKIF